MQSHEYRVVPAPRRGLRAKGLRRHEDRFAHAIESEMNRMAAEGWEFVRSDTLPCERKAGWFSRPSTVFETLLVFRRAKAATQVGRHASSAMPPPLDLAPPVAAGPAEEPRRAPPIAPPAAAPAASRFTPVPRAPQPANDAAPATPPGPLLTVVEPDRPDPQAGPKAPNPRLAAE